MWQKYAFLALVVPLHLLIFQGAAVIIGGLFGGGEPLPLSALIVPALLLVWWCDTALLTRWVGMTNLSTAMATAVAGGVLPVIATLVAIYTGTLAPMEALIAVSILTIGVYALLLRNVRRA
ncbi:hypothetical protein [Yoonia sp. 208BN28-4]|uniref:hypothetical protein n=1 Tax=Yoonia sp. 208BN28-4 TaxID=3126505 RepID=UPI00309FAEC7